MEWSSSLYLWSTGFAFAWGALWGSFFNVVIYRLPAGLSVITPPSHCPHCKTRLRAYHNVPVLGWLFLRGKCATCRAPISVRYPLVELLTAVLSAALWLRLASPDAGFDPLAAIAPFGLLFLFLGSLIVITFIDIDYRIIPHEITLPLLALGMVSSLVNVSVTGVGWKESVLGALVGGGIIWLIIQVYFWLRKVEGMGGGDFVMMAMLGAWLGYASILFILFAASLQGTVAAVVLYVSGKSLPQPAIPGPGWGGSESEPDPPDPGSVAQPGLPDGGFRSMELPFGPFLALAGLEWLFFEPWIRTTVYALYGG
ncbi:MAG: prepilin peptidase [Myxococcales bacterium]|nr:prepilin peptidase [Myxococcales bacterium]